MVRKVSLLYEALKIPTKNVLPFLHLTSQEHHVAALSSAVVNMLINKTLTSNKFVIFLKSCNICLVAHFPKALNQTVMWYFFRRCLSSNWGNGRTVVPNGPVRNTENISKVIHTLTLNRRCYKIYGRILTSISISVSLFSSFQFHITLLTLSWGVNDQWHCNHPLYKFRRESPINLVIWCFFYVNRIWWFSSKLQCNFKMSSFENNLKRLLLVCCLKLSGIALGIVRPCYRCQRLRLRKWSPCLCFDFLTSIVILVFEESV